MLDKSRIIFREEWQDADLLSHSSPPPLPLITSSSPTHELPGLPGGVGGRRAAEAARCECEYLTHATLGEAVQGRRGDQGQAGEARSSALGLSGSQNCLFRGFNEKSTFGAHSARLLNAVSARPPTLVPKLNGGRAINL